MFIENCAMYEVQQGKHSDPGEYSMLIQIVDPGHEFPEPKFDFKFVNQYQFHDIEDDKDGWIAFNNEQAKSIATNLKFAFDNNFNVIVHCMMGVCRSGAVVEVGTMLGFEDTGRWRQPNLHVKKLLMKHLNLLQYG